MTHGRILFTVALIVATWCSISPQGALAQHATTSDLGKLPARDQLGFNVGNPRATITFTRFDGTTYFSPDGGYGWVRKVSGKVMDSTSFIATHMPHRSVTFTRFDGSTSTSLDGGRSFWRGGATASQSGKGSTAQTSTLQSSAEVTSVQPNPTTGRTEILYQVFAQQDVTLSIQDRNGRNLLILQDGNMAPGKYTATFDASKLSSGIYTYRLAGKNITTSGTIVVKH